MRVGLRQTAPSGCQWIMVVLTLLIAGCSKPEEVISRRLSQANQNLEAGRVDEAIKTLERLNQTYIDQPAVLEALGFAYARAGQHTAAAASFVRAADVDPRSASLRQLAADAYALAHEPERAAQQYRLYVDEFPADYRGREKLGAIEEKNGDLVRALDQYLECYRLHPSGDFAWRVGSVFRRLNNAPQTKSWLETTIKHAEAHVQDALLGLLELELNSRDFAAAERTVGQLDRIYPGTLDASPLATAREDLVVWREQQKALAVARASQEKAARDIEAERRRQEAALTEIGSQPTPDPIPPRTSTVPPPTAIRAPVVSSPAAAPATGTVAGTPSEAATEPESDTDTTVAAQEIAPETEAALASPTAADVLAALELKERGDHDGAVAALWTIVATDDKRVDAWLELGNCYRAMKNYGDAESCLLEAARREPDNIEVTVAMLEVVREVQPRDVYLARIESARRKHPDNADIAFIYARELAASDGATARAISAYEDFLLLAPANDQRRREANEFLARVRGY